MAGVQNCASHGPQNKHLGCPPRVVGCDSTRRGDCDEVGLCIGCVGNAWRSAGRGGRWGTCITCQCSCCQRALPLSASSPASTPAPSRTTPTAPSTPTPSVRAKSSLPTFLQENLVWSIAAWLLLDISYSVSVASMKLQQKLVARALGLAFCACMAQSLAACFISVHACNVVMELLLGRGIIVLFLHDVHVRGSHYPHLRRSLCFDVCIPLSLYQIWETLLLPEEDTCTARREYWSGVAPCAGHWLGMDTHDTRCIGHDAPMRAGVVLTIEPGLYIPNDPQLYGPYAGIGVRIEDDVAVTGLTDPEVLSAGVPVDAREVELLVQGKWCDPVKDAWENTRLCFADFVAYSLVVYHHVIPTSTSAACSFELGQQFCCGIVCLQLCWLLWLRGVLGSCTLCSPASVAVLFFTSLGQARGATRGMGQCPAAEFHKLWVSVAEWFSWRALCDKGGNFSCCITINSNRHENYNCRRLASSGMLESRGQLCKILHCFTNIEYSNSDCKVQSKNRWQSLAKLISRSLWLMALLSLRNKVRTKHVTVLDSSKAWVGCKRETWNYDTIR